MRALQRLLEQKYEGAVWPHIELPATAESLMEAVLARVSRSSALWQQFAFLCDLIVATRDGARYYEELPSAYVRESEFGKSDNYFTITINSTPSMSPSVASRKTSANGRMRAGICTRWCAASAVATSSQRTT